MSAQRFKCPHCGEAIEIQLGATVNAGEWPPVNREQLLADRAVEKSGETLAPPRVRTASNPQGNVSRKKTRDVR